MRKFTAYDMRRMYRLGKSYQECEAKLNRLEEMLKRIPNLDFDITVQLGSFSIKIPKENRPNIKDALLAYRETVQSEMGSIQESLNALVMVLQEEKEEG